MNRNVSQLGNNNATQTKKGTNKVAASRAVRPTRADARAAYLEIKAEMAAEAEEMFSADDIYHHRGGRQGDGKGGAELGKCETCDTKVQPIYWPKPNDDRFAPVRLLKLREQRTVLETGLIRHYECPTCKAVRSRDGGAICQRCGSVRQEICRGVWGCVVCAARQAVADRLHLAMHRLAQAVGEPLDDWLLPDDFRTLPEEALRSELGSTENPQKVA
jgi:hypothetical protein